MMIRKTFGGFAAAAVLLFGCSESESYSADYTIKIQPTISRVTGLRFDTNDQIGLTVTYSGGEYIRNQMLSYTGSCFEADNLLWYEDDSKTSTLIAYYPYSAAGMPTEFSVLTDQHEGSASSSLLAAVKNDVKPGTAPVGMTFSRLLSSILVHIENKSSSAVTKVVAAGTIPTALVDIQQKIVQVKSGAAPADITASSQSAGTRYEVVLIPQTATMTFTFHLLDGKARSQTLAAAQLESGKQYTLSVVITSEQVQMTLSADIQNWGDGGELGGGEPGGGDGGDGGGDVETGILTYQGEEYHTVQIAGRVWMAENMRYIPDQSLMGAGIWYPAKDGVESSDPAYIKAQGLFYDFTTATDGATITAGVPVQGICPAGWQLPDDALLQSLVTDKAYDYTAFASYVGFWNTQTRKYGAMTRSYLLGVGEAADAKRNYLFLEQGTPQPSILAFSSANGVLVRCVKAKK